MVYNKICSNAGQTNVEKRKPRQTPVIIDAVRELVLSQEGHPHSHRSAREITATMRAREDDNGQAVFGPISRSSIQRIVKETLHLKPLTRSNVHSLTAVQQERRLVACRNWLVRRAPHIRRLLFSDEKVSLPPCIWCTCTQSADFPRAPTFFTYT
jgi:hypothetical protein